MAFSIKQLLFCTAVVAFGLVAFLSFDMRVAELFDLLTLGILIAMAYGVWLAQGGLRAFRIGFLTWAVLYYLLFKKTFNVGVVNPVNLAHRVWPEVMFWPDSADSILNRHSVGHSLSLLLFGLIGGWVTVYFYRRRQRMLNHTAPQ